MQSLSISPSTVVAGETVTISWSRFREGYTILLESVSGPGTVSSAIGDTSSGSITSPALIDVGVWEFRARQPSPMGELISNTVTLTVTSEAVVCYNNPNLRAIYEMAEKNGLTNVMAICKTACEILTPTTKLRYRKIIR